MDSYQPLQGELTRKTEKHNILSNIVQNIV